MTFYFDKELNLHSPVRQFLNPEEQMIAVAR